METIIMNFTFVNGDCKNYTVFSDSIKNEGVFISFTALAWLSNTETNTHKINLDNVVSIDYYKDIIDLVGNIQPNSEPKGIILKKETETDNLIYVLFFIFSCISIGLSIFNLYR